MTTLTDSKCWVSCWRCNKHFISFHIRSVSCLSFHFSLYFVNWNMRFCCLFYHFLFVVFMGFGGSSYLWLSYQVHHVRYSCCLCLMDLACMSFWRFGVVLEVQSFCFCWDLYSSDFQVVKLCTSIKPVSKVRVFVTFSR